MKAVIMRRLKDHDKWRNSKWSQGELWGSHDDIMGSHDPWYNTGVIVEVQDIKQALLDTVRYRWALIEGA